MFLLSLPEASRRKTGGFEGLSCKAMQPAHACEHRGRAQEDRRVHVKFRPVIQPEPCHNPSELIRDSQTFCENEGSSTVLFVWSVAGVALLIMGGRFVTGKGLIMDQDGIQDFLRPIGTEIKRDVRPEGAMRTWPSHVEMHRSPF